MSSSQDTDHHRAGVSVLKMILCEEKENAILENHKMNY